MYVIHTFLKKVEPKNGKIDLMLRVFEFFRRVPTIDVTFFNLPNKRKGNIRAIF